MKPDELPNCELPRPSWADPGLATMAEEPVADQQSVWLGHGPEVLHSPVMRSGSKRILGMAVLVTVVAGLAGAMVVYFLSGSSPNRMVRGQIPAPPTTAVPRAQPALPSAPPSAAPVTAAAPVFTPAAPVSTPEASVAPEAPVMTPATPPPVELAPSSPSRRPSGRTTEEHRAVVPPPPSNGSSGDEDQPPPANAYPDSPDPTSAPEGFTRVPYKPWKPPAP